jgi:DNA-binding CsgD family transcriptional regulator
MVCVLLALAPPKHQRRIDGRGGVALFTALLAVCLACTLLAGMSIVSEIRVYYLLGAVVGAAVAAILARWLTLLSNFDPRSVVSILLTALILVLASFILIHFFRKILRDPLLTTACSMALLACSGALHLAARSRLASHGDSAMPVDNDQAQDLVLADGSDADARLRTPQHAALVRLTAFSLAISAVLQFLLMFNIGYNKSGLFVRDGGDLENMGMRAGVEILGCLLCGAVIIALLITMRKTARQPGLIVMAIHRIIALSTVMAVGLSLSAGMPAVITYTFVLLAYFLAQIGVWSLALHVGFLYDLESTEHVLHPLFAQFFGCFIGFAVSGIVSEPMLRSPFFADGALLACLALTCVLFLFVFTDRDVNRSSHVAHVIRNGEKGIDERCRLAQERYALTNRETEVLTLLAHGRNAITIQERLFVSYNTVKAHKHNLYGKLGIHSQQELLTLIEQID